MQAKNKKILIWGSVGAALAVILAVALILVLSGKKENNTPDPPAPSASAGVSHTTARETKPQMSGSAEVSFKCVNTWESDSYHFGQFELIIENNSDQAVRDWEITFWMAQDAVMEQVWNCETTGFSEEQTGCVSLEAVAYNSEIFAGQRTEGIGFIVCSTLPPAVLKYRLELTFEDSSVRIFEADVDGGLSEETETASEADEGGTAQEPADSETEETFIQGAAGGLKVTGTGLTDGSGRKVQLRGVSTHGLAWYPEYVNMEAFETLKAWGANVVRLAMYTEEYGGYCSGGDRAALKAKIDDGVKAAAALGMYVIIDWHILSDGNPNTHREEAIAFFDEMSARYSSYDHVIYEICNEPVNAPWESEIKPYAEAVIKTIRSHDSEALILVGTNRWSQEIDAVIGNELSDRNTMYVMHFYAGTHRDDLRNKLEQALDSGIPVFISECGICDASGNGGIDYASAQAWLELLNRRGVSFVAWNLSNKNESAALLRPDCTETFGWTDEALSESGRWFKEAIGGNTP